MSPLPPGAKVDALPIKTDSDKHDKSKDNSTKPSQPVKSEVKPIKKQVDQQPPQPVQSEVKPIQNQVDQPSQPEQSEV